MTEDDTFKKLKGLTREEAEIMHNKLYQKFSKTSKTVGEVKDKIDIVFLSYGWKCSMLDDADDD